LKRLLASAVLVSTYGLAYLISALTRGWLKSTKRHNRIIVNGTFHNPNWFHAHITPLVNSGFGEVLLVCDAPIAELPNLIYKCPPTWANKIFSRAGAKFLWTFFIGFKHPADVYIGYHIFPSAITALICARLFGSKVVYQLTAGELELQGGGWNVENKVMVSLGSPSSVVEGVAHQVLRQFDLAIVRGSNAKNYVIKQKFSGNLEVVTGSVETSLPISEEKDIDLIFVGRLSEYKRPDRLLKVVAGVVKSIPEMKATLVGDGPDRAALEAQAKELNIEKNVIFLGQRTDVPALLGRAKLFTLTSRWEGVSIAMLEAMAMKAVPVVSEVGDLKDFARNGETGYAINEENLEEFVSRIVELLSDDQLRNRLAQNARELVVAKCDRDILSKRWCDILDQLIS
jgi:glycosyltransferase involved in cell wall biosynthesis